MADLSQLSDDELLKLAGRKRDIRSLSDAELLAAAGGRSTGQQIARGIAMPAAGFNESVATTLGALPDMVGAGLRAAGLPSSRPGVYTDAIRSGMQWLTGKPPTPEGTMENLLYGAGKGAGDAASVLIPATAVAGATRAGTMTNAVAQALASQPVTQATAGAAGGAVGQATDSPLAGLAASVATPLVMGAAGRALRPVRPANTPERQALIDALTDARVPLTPAERTGSKALGYLEGAFDVLPGSSAARQALRAERDAAFNAASLAYSGTDARVASPEVLNAARARIGGTINEIANRNVLVVTPALEGRLAQIEDSLRFVPGEVAGPVRARLEQLRGMALPTVPGTSHAAVIPGASYRTMDSAIGRTIRSTSNGDLRAAMGDLRTALREGMDASIGPEDQAAWQEARRHYANLMVTARAAGGAGAGAAEGNVSPLRLREAVNQSTGQNYAFGQGDQNTLARAGQSVLRTPPDSGTAGRQFYQGLLTGSAGGTGLGALVAGGGVLPAVAAAGATFAGPRLAHMAYQSPLIARYLIEGVPGLGGLADSAPRINRSLVAALLAGNAKPTMPGKSP